MLLLFLKSLEDVVPHFIHTCPYKGTHEALDMDVDKLISQMFPQVIPEGEYKVVIHAHTTSNETIGIITVKGLMKAKNFWQTMQIG